MTAIYLLILVLFRCRNGEEMTKANWANFLDGRGLKGSFQNRSLAGIQFSQVPKSGPGVPGKYSLQCSFISDYEESGEIIRNFSSGFLNLVLRLPGETTFRRRDETAPTQTGHRAQSA